MQIWKEDILEDISAIEYRLDENEQFGKITERTIDKEKESVRRLGERIEFDRAEKEREIENIDKFIEQEKGNIDNFPKQFERDKGSIESEFRAEEESLSRQTESVERNIAKEPEEFERNRRRIEDYYTAEDQRFITEAENGNISGSGRYAKEFACLSSFRNALYTYKSSLELLERVEQKERDNSKKN